MFLFKELEFCGDREELIFFLGGTGECGTVSPTPLSELLLEEAF